MKASDSIFFPTTPQGCSTLSEEGWHVWCGSALRAGDGRYHMVYARWPETEGFEAWVTHSELAHAVSECAGGPYVPAGRLWGGGGGVEWDSVVHNPMLMHWEGRYYMYYMGTHRPASGGGWWDYRNAQRIGVAVAGHPAGPWRRFPEPVLDVTPNSWDDLACSNPTCTRGPDGRFYMVYKGIGSDGPMPKGGSVQLGLAVADDPCGPFKKHGEPILSHPTEKWAFEDPFLWHDGRHFRLLAKDYSGRTSGGLAGHCALAVSDDAIHWEFPENRPAFPLEMPEPDGSVRAMARMERPFLLQEEGGSPVLFLACLEAGKPERSFNAQFVLESPIL